MNILIILLLLLAIVLILSSAKKKENLEIYHKENNASFIAEVKEFAKWGELIFRKYCDIVGNDSTLSELKNAELYDKCQRFVMLKVNIKRRNYLALNFIVLNTY